MFSILVYDIPVNVGKVPMASKKGKPRSKPAKQAPPLQFRPGVELERLVESFAAERGLRPNEACKVLIALAITAMDVRYYGLMHQLAEAMGGASAFVSACIHVQSRLEGAALMAGRPLWREPERSLFMLKIIQEFLQGKGLEVPTQGLWFLSQEEQAPPQAEEARPKVKVNPTERRTRTTRKVDESDRPKQVRPQAGTEDETEEEAGWSALQGQGEQQRTRT
jgi:hypothetical protein